MGYCAGKLLFDALVSSVGMTGGAIIFTLLWIFIFSEIMFVWVVGSIIWAIIIPIIYLTSLKEE